MFAFFTLDGPPAAGPARAGPADAGPAAAGTTRTSLDAMFRAHAAFVWRVLRHHGVPDRDLDDACQEVFLVVQRRGADEGDERGALTTFLHAIAWRVASTFRRSTSRRREVLDPSPAEGFAAPDPHELVEQQRVLVRLLTALDDDKRAVVVLYEIEERPMREVAAILDIPLQTAYSRLQAAHRELRVAHAQLQKEAP